MKKNIYPLALPDRKHLTSLLKRLNFKRSDFKAIQNFKIPDNFGELKEIASRLAKFSQNKFVRIDLYTINGNIYFQNLYFSLVADIYHSIQKKQMQKSAKCFL